MSRQEAAAQYQEALKAGRKTYKDRVLRGQYPYPQVLDEILDDAMSAGQVDLGLLEIPTDRVTGTKTQGRRDAFAADFMPLMPADSEFASKWITLCAAHLSDEGIGGQQASQRAQELRRAVRPRVCDADRARVVGGSRHSGVLRLHARLPVDGALSGAVQPRGPLREAAGGAGL